jgi:hypothetical protein
MSVRDLARGRASSILPALSVLPHGVHITHTVTEPAADVPVRLTKSHCHVPADGPVALSVNNAQLLSVFRQYPPVTNVDAEQAGDTSVDP